MLDPWQRTVLDAGLAEETGGRWAAQAIDLLVARQNGKNGIVEIRELFGAVVLGEKVLHTAHLFATSMEAWRRCGELIAAHPDIERQIVAKAGSSAAGYFWKFRSGGRLRFLARSKSAGRGFTDDVLILDEAQGLEDVHLGALLPALSARSVEGDPQTWYLGSAPNPTQFVWQRRRKAWRRGAVPRTASFEWSGQIGDDLDDRRVWAEANPGYGVRISEDYIASSERPSMSDEEFARERLSISPEVADDGENVILVGWTALADPAARLVGRPTFALDVSPDRRWCSIAAAGVTDGARGRMVEVVDRREGTSWAVARAAELHARWNPPSLIVDPAGPAGSLIGELERAGVPVRQVTAREHGAACGLIFDAVRDGTVAHLDDRHLNAAAAGAVPRPVGEAWLWNRTRSDLDISPLVAVTLALWGYALGHADEDPEPHIW